MSGNYIYLLKHKKYGTICYYSKKSMLKKTLRELDDDYYGLAYKAVNDNFNVEDVLDMINNGPDVSYINYSKPIRFRGGYYYMVRSDVV
jgi:hypothetical protein